MAIQNAAILVDLNIGAWTGRKLDKNVSSEIDVAKGTKAKGGNYHKHLLAGSDKLDAVQKIVSAARVWHYEQTMPWSDGGSRLLPMKNFFDYKRSLSGLFERNYWAAVGEFKKEYPTLVTAAAFQLGALFNRADYPDLESIENKFKFNYVFMPVPTAGDFRIQATDEAIAELQAQAEQHVNTRLNDAMKDIWTRLHECLSHMSTKLADLPTPRVLKNGTEMYSQVFRDSLVNNAVELCGLLTKLNVTDDPSLEQARRKLEDAMFGVTADDLREDDGARAALKSEVDSILKAFSF